MNYGSTGHQSSSSTNTSKTAATSPSTSPNNVCQIVVKGSSFPPANGTYTKVGQTFKGAPVYRKGSYVIYRFSTSMGPNNWYISVWNGNVSSIGTVSSRYYGSPNNADSMTPPTNGWEVLIGTGPAPKLQLVTANNDADSEGAQKVNACGNVE